jgi:DNA polymerase elongation subunit (family B)
MTAFYTSIDRKGSFFRLRGYENGMRVKLKVPIEPKLYIKTKKKIDSPYKSIFGDSLEMMKLDNPRDAQQFIDRYKDVDGFEVHGMQQWAYPFLNERYPGVLKYDESKIRGIIYDIEVDTVGGLPNIDAANKEIVSISALKTNGDLVAWGLNPYKPKKLDGYDVEYRRFSSEKSLLQDFIVWFRDFDPDYISGWNIEGFDVPYMVRRIISVCGEEWVKQLSPWGEVTSRMIKDRYGESEVFEIAGVATLDYLDLYKKFTYQKQENYSLDFISQEELDVKKLDYKAEGYKDLADLYVRNHDLFIDYNVIDVIRVKQIDQKMGLLSLVFSLAYTAKVEYGDTLGTVKLWDAIIHNHLMSKNIIVPMEVEGRQDVVEGAYVKPPIAGLYKWVLAFDLDSLYPHLIMQNNISPETFASYMAIRPQDVLAQNQMFLNVRERAIGEDWAICGNGALYRKDKTGFLPELMEKFYADRKKAKKEMLGLEQRKENGEKGLESEISRLNNLQMALKIALNSAYGALGNKYFRYFDSRAAEGITQTGYVAIQWVADRMNNALRKLTDQPNKDFVIAMDTDSMYLNLEDVVNMAYKGEDKSHSAIADWLSAVVEPKLQKVIDKSYEDLKELLNSPHQKMIMKRESICDRAVWVAKKRYILRVIDSEGVRYKEPKLKVSGLESKRSSTPALVKDGLERCYNKIIEMDESQLQDEVAKFREEFFAASLYEIAIPSTANDIESHSLVHSKSIPYHVKASLIYNKLVVDRNLTSKFPLIKNGDKIRLWILKDRNPLAANYFAMPVGMTVDASLLEPRYVDVEALFERLFLNPIASTIESLNWTPEPVSNLEAFFG